MKCLFAVAFLALVAATLAGPVIISPATHEGEKSVEPVTTDDGKDTRDKRGLIVTSYATAPISAPVAYQPAAYSAGLPVSYVQSYPYFVGYNPAASYAVA